MLQSISQAAPEVCTDNNSNANTTSTNHNNNTNADGSNNTKHDMQTSCALGVAPGSAISHTPRGCVKWNLKLMT